MDFLTCSLMEYMNKNKESFNKLKTLSEGYNITYIHDLNYVKTTSGEVYYTAMCNLISSYTEHQQRITIEKYAMDLIYRNLKINKIMGGLKKLT